MIARKLHLFGTADYPLRPSALATLVKCPLQAVLKVLDELEDTSGVAADTGSLAHEAVAAFHLEPDANKRIGAAVAMLQQAAPKFPQADVADARITVERYVADSRNAGAKVVAVERPVRLVLDPHPSDPTGQPVVINGKLDQLRESNGRITVWDLKTGKPGGREMSHEHSLQQAAYVLAARQSGFPTAEPGGLIRTAAYRTRGAQLPMADGVFWDLPFTLADCPKLLSRVTLTVALIRSGEVDYGPGSWCVWCPLGGLDRCIVEADRKLFALPLA